MKPWKYTFICRHCGAGMGPVNVHVDVLDCEMRCVACGGVSHHIAESPVTRSRHKQAMRTMIDSIDWSNLPKAQAMVTYWANLALPKRVPEKSLSKLVLEEIPELLTHLKEHGSMAISGELADCFILLMDLATMWRVDIATAVRDKMVINAERSWRYDPSTGFFNHKEDAYDNDNQGSRPTGTSGGCQAVDDTGGKPSSVDSGTHVPSVGASTITI